MKNPVIGINVLLETHTEHTRNLVRDYYAVQDKYVNAVDAAGGLPLLIPPLEDEEKLNAYLDKADAMLFIGGPDYPPAWYQQEKDPNTQTNRLRSECDLFLMRETLQRKLPLMAICAGHQLLNIVRGGKLIQDMSNAKEHVNGVTHQSKITKNGIFSELCTLNKGDSIVLNSYHHQCVDPDFVGEKLQVTALAFDNSIEVLEGTDETHFVLGLQFHIERQDNLRKVFFERLIAEARR